MNTILRVQILGVLSQIMMVVATPAARAEVTKLWVRAEACQDASELGRLLEFAKETSAVLVDPVLRLAAIEAVEVEA